MVKIDEDSLLEQLSPLVESGYKVLAARVMGGVNAWNSALSPETRREVDEVLSTALVARKTPAPVLYVAKGSAVERRVVSKSGSLLGDSVSSVNKQLSALQENGDVSRITLEGFDTLMSVLSYSCFGKNSSDRLASVIFACTLAATYYAATGKVEFANQLKYVTKLGGIRLEESGPAGVDYSADGSLSVLTFNVSDKRPALPNIVTALRLLYLAGHPPVDWHADGASDGLESLSEKLVAVSVDRGGVDSVIPAAYLSDKSTLISIAGMLETVRLHCGVEAMISHPHLIADVKLRDALLLGKALDTVQTAKVALIDRDVSYSRAIGIAELVEAGILQQTI